MECLSKNSEYVVNCVKRRKENLKRVFHSKCCLCGFSSFSEALEFHHVNPKEKSFGICASNATTKSLEKQLKEMRKCILVCANCHRGIHYGYLTIPKNWKDYYDEDIAKELLENLRKATTKTEYFCQRCGKKIASNARYCVECGKFVQRKVERPTREELKDLIRRTPFTHIGKMYQVTDNTIRKWCKSYNLPSKVKEIKQYSDEQWKKI